MNIVLVYNKKSGSTPSLRKLERLCKDNGITIIKALSLDKELPRRLKTFISQGDTIAVFGGDGSISTVAGMIAGTKATLAPLPGGTLNHFTKDLGVAQNLEEALRDLVRSRPRMIDVGTVNGVVFVNNSSIGLYPSSLQERGRLEYLFGKWVAAVIAAVKVFIRFKTYDLKINNKKYRTPFVFVGNNRYNIDVPGVAERGRLDENVLTVFIAHTTSRLTMLKLVLFALIGKGIYLDEFDREYTRELIVEADRSIIVSRDGEMERFTSPLVYRCEPKRMRVRR